jgi:ribosome silencing factor RsfS/YbeB/iojap
MAKKVNKKSSKPVSKAKPKLAGKSAGKAASKAAPKKVVKKTAVKAKAKPAAKPARKVAAKPAAKPAVKVTKKVAANTKAKSAAKSVAKPVAKVAAAAVPKKAPQPAAPSAVKPVKKSAPKPAAKAASPHATFTEPSHASSPSVAMTGTPATPNTPIEQSRAFAIEAARLLSDDKCTDIVVLDVSKLGAEQDFIIIGSGTSDRQMRSVLDDVAELGTASGHTIAHQSIDDRATWVLADFFDVVIHLFEPNTRAYYDLEMMWGDAPKVAWERAPGDTPKHRNRRVIVNAANEESATAPSTNED